MHLARILAADASQYSASLLAAAPSQNSNSSNATAPASTAQHAQQHSNGNKPRQSQPWQDDVAYLAPPLAFNLGLQYELTKLQIVMQLLSCRQVMQKPCMYLQAAAWL